jgi:hypothetical protein
MRDTLSKAACHKEKKGGKKEKVKNVFFYHRAFGARQGKLP